MNNIFSPPKFLSERIENDFCRRVEIENKSVNGFNGILGAISSETYRRPKLYALFTLCFNELSKLFFHYRPSRFDLRANGVVDVIKETALEIHLVAFEEIRD